MTTYYKLLQEAGYHTMAVGKLDLNKNDTLNSFGWNHEGNLHAEEWGFSDMVNCVGVFESYFLTEAYPNGSYIEPYTDYLLEHNATDVFLNDTRSRTDGGNTKIGDPRFYKDAYPNPLPDDLYNDNWVADQALRLLSEKPNDKEWFMIVNWNGPHYPMSITESMYGRIQNRSFPQPVDYTGNFTAEMHNRTRADYAAMIENIDAHIGRILAAVNMSDTLVVFASDHGEMLGDRGLWATDVPFQPSVNVPLVIAGDVVNESLRGTSTDAGVSLIDLARTFLDVGEVQTVPAQMSEAYSFRPLLEGEPHKKRVLRSALGTWKLWFDGRYKYVIGYSDDEPMLFDVETDPHERTNLLLSTNTTELAHYASIIQWLLGKGKVVQ
ncbi:Choline-sulfatase [Phytophthora nicotianae]|nr:Choline-sulfatase [Phytophthora nicotianae]